MTEKIQKGETLRKHKSNESTKQTKEKQETWGICKGKSNKQNKKQFFNKRSTNFLEGFLKAHTVEIFEVEVHYHLQHL